MALIKWLQFKKAIILQNLVKININTFAKDQLQLWKDLMLLVSAPPCKLTKIQY